MESKLYYHYPKLYVEPSIYLWQHNNKSLMYIIMVLWQYNDLYPTSILSLSVISRSHIQNCVFFFIMKKIRVCKERYNHKINIKQAIDPAWICSHSINPHASDTPCKYLGTLSFFLYLLLEKKNSFTMP